MPGISLDAVDNRVDTKLYRPGYGINLELVRQLILDKLPLQAALRQEDPELIEFLLQIGADLSEVEETALHSAIHRHHSIVEILLRHGSNVNALDSQRRAPLHIVCTTDNHFALTYLLNYGADVNLLDPKLRTPLHVAIEFRKFDHIRPLLRQGTNPNLQDEQSRTPLHLLCASHGIKTQTVKWFLDGSSVVPVDVNASSFWGTPLHVACKLQRLDLVELLVAHGADVNNLCHCFPNDQQRRDTPLSLVFFRFEPDHVEWQDPDPDLAEHMNISWDVPALFGILKCLLSHSVNVNYSGIDASVEIPIVGAMKCMREAFALQLLKHGSPVDVSIDGKPLLIKACELRMYDLVLALLKMQWNQTRLIGRCLKKVLRQSERALHNYMLVMYRDRQEESHQEELQRLCILRITKPLSLSTLAASTVRRGLSNAKPASILGRIDKLPLPKELKETLRLDNVIPDRDFL